VVSRTPHRWRADLALVAMTFIWGATFVVVKSALENASTFLFLTLRFTLATVALGLVFRPLPSRFASGRSILKGGAIAGSFLFLGYAFQTMGLRHTTPSKSAFITGLSIVMVPVMAALVQRRAPALREAVGVFVATVGMAFMTLDFHSLEIAYGDALTLLCAAGFALHILVVGHYAPKTGFSALALVQIAVAAALSGATFWWIEPVIIRWTPGVVLAVLVTGLLATALAFSVQAWAQQYTTPTRTALIFALEPVFAAVTSFLVAGELLSPQGSAGAALILGGILLVELKPQPSRGGPVPDMSSEPADDPKPG
jgi:drug/metabolite transporter (DMT)-like permease